ncbi:hypothetical protein AB0J80_32125 [Actinoplanes sp. NPDC049548]|uniref:hypothetical protein n=1 Tax=Actinoplanes sp. NPDC049548 TaxID=3155152 RepID=UPI00342CCBF2
MEDVMNEAWDVAFDPFTIAGQEAMGDILARARAQSPVFYSSRLQAWIVTRIW